MFGLFVECVGVTAMQDPCFVAVIDEIQEKVSGCRSNISKLGVTCDGEEDRIVEVGVWLSRW
jgi:hypothetical protein